jgi:DNA-binding response OmpR family regulator
MNPPHNPRILLIEDDENDAFFFERAAVKAGLPVSVVRDGQDAIHYLSGAGTYADRQAHPLPGIVVLDLNLPVKHGLEVLKWIRAQRATHNLIVLVLTSSIDVLDLHQAYSLGANSYLVKPSDPIELAGVVTAIKVYWLSYNAPPPVPADDPRLAHLLGHGRSGALNS